MINIVLADHHCIFREGLRALLERERDLTVLEETGDGIEAVRIVEAMQPNVLVVGISMPGLNGLGVTRQVRKRVPGTQVVVVTRHTDDVYVLEALRHGAAGYVLKQDKATEVVQAIRKAARGRRFLSSSIAERAIEVYARHAEYPDTDPYQTLSSREQEVMQLTAEGHTAAQIAERLSISPRTVEAHRAKLMRKLGLSKLADLMRYALHRGLIPVQTALPGRRVAW